nr:MAG: PQQ-dependent dehydrogenase, methanol/ethanol family [Pseudomonadota bacterium]
MRTVLITSVCAAALVVSACGRSGAPEGRDSAAPAEFANVDEARLVAADEHPGQWMSHGRTYSEQRFSPLTQINTENVSQLGLTWYADFDTRRGQESTPLVIDGVVYVTTAWSKVYAFDAKTGKELWKYDPKVPGEWAVNACCDVVNRGVAAWKGKLYLGALDGRLIAIDAKTGKPVWEVYTIDRDKPYTITGAPRVAKGKVIIGQGGSEFHMRGYVSAYDAETGEMLWRWYIVPGNPADGFENPQMEMAAKTWGGEWWKTGGGGAPWDGITYDPETNLVYVGTGNGAPWPADIRSPGGGDHLFLASIVALDVDTGEYRWHYQMTPNESWDYDNTQQITVADLVIDGKKRHVVMQASKNGFFYVLDAKTGELISAQNFVPVNWAKGIDMKTGRPIVNPESKYTTERGFVALPSFAGAHSWHPMSYSPITGLVYIPAVNSSYPFVAAYEDDNPMGQKLSISFAKSAEMLRDPKTLRVNEGILLAWDPVQQKEVWRVSHGQGRGGGTLATAGGLVFQGTGGGLQTEGLSVPMHFSAYRADDGTKLWSFAAQTGVLAGPVSYEVDGEQYIAVVAGHRQGGDYYSPNYSRLLVFKLGGTAELPPPIEVPPRRLDPPAPFGTTAQLTVGEEKYSRFCSTCHGVDAQSGGMFPDLRYSPTLHSQEAFDAIVLGGALTENGMVSFARAITPEEAQAIRAFVTQRANEAKQREAAATQAAAPAQQGHGASN